MPTAMRRPALALIALACLCIAGPARAADSARSAEELYRAVVADPIRTDQDRRIDAARKPAEFLPFIGVMPGMQVLDVSAGGGYTSQLLALAVGPTGKLYAQAPSPSANLTKRVADRPQAQFTIVARPFDDPVPPGAPPLDLITIVLNYHDIANLPIDRAKMNARLYAALKPGGRIVVVDHSAKVGSGTAHTRTLHRIDEGVVRRELAEAGFVFDGEGTYLRNPDDTREHGSGNPPIPTDKFVLRFVKPR